MPSLFQLLVIAGVALVVLVLWRYPRAPAARTKDASIPAGKRFERRKRQRRVRRSTIRFETERRQGRGRRADDQLG